jgi:hypothetical protein
MTAHLPYAKPLNPMSRNLDGTGVRRLAGFLFGVLLLIGSATPLFAATAATDAAADSQFATVHRLRGTVTAGTPSGADRSLREGDRIFIGEKVRASATSEAVLRTLDAGMVALRPGAEFVVQGFKAQGDKNDNMALRLLTGSLRIITGWIGRSNPSAHQIITPSATIGIRGTDHEPFVLTEDKPVATSAKPYRAGTYDKVNRGGTTLSAGGQDLAIEPGRVGFSRAESSTQRSRALMTLLLPVLLDKVPEFYVPGAFDGELDRFSENADAMAAVEMDKKLNPAAPGGKGATSATATVTTAAPIAAAAVSTAAPAPEPRFSGKCVPATIAKSWVTTLDDAITRKDATTILGQFASDVAVKAIVRKADGSLTEVDFTRDELVRSTLSTVNQLEGYQHRRISIDAKKSPAAKSGSCGPLLVKSVVLEQGKLSGKPYRFESTEDYVLELRDGKWLATKAESAQR